MLAALVLNLGGPLILQRVPLQSSGDVVAPEYLAHVTGGRIAIKGQFRRLYDIGYQQPIQHEILRGTPHSCCVRFDDAFDDPPFAALLYALPSLLPYLDGAALWVAGSAILIGVSLWLLWPSVPSIQRYGFRHLALLVFSTYPVVLLLVGGQDSALLLFIFVLGLRLLTNRHDLAAGAVLGLGVLKPQLFLLVPIFLLCQRRWRALGSWSVTATGLATLSIALVGISGIAPYRQLLGLVFKGTSYSVLTLWSMPSFSALLREAQVVVPRPYAILGTILLSLIILTLVAIWARNVFHPARERRELSLLYASTVLLAGLLAVHFFYYDAVIMLLPALIFLDDAPTDQTPRYLLVTIYFLSWTVPFITGFLVNLPRPLNLLSFPWCIVPLTILFLYGQRRLVQSFSAADDAAAELGGLPERSR